MPCLPISGSARDHAALTPSPSPSRERGVSPRICPCQGEHMTTGWYRGSDRQARIRDAIARHGYDVLLAVTPENAHFLAGHGNYVASTLAHSRAFFRRGRPGRTAVGGDRRFWHRSTCRSSL